MTQGRARTSSQRSDAAALTTEGEAGWLPLWSQRTASQSTLHPTCGGSEALPERCLLYLLRWPARRHVLRPTLAHVRLNLPLQKEEDNCLYRKQISRGSGHHFQRNHKDLLVGTPGDATCGIYTGSYTLIIVLLKTAIKHI